MNILVPAALAAVMLATAPAQAADCAVRPAHKPVAHRTVHRTVHRAVHKPLMKKAVKKTAIRRAEPVCGCGAPPRDPVRHPVILRPDGPYFIDGIPHARRVEVRETAMTPMRRGHDMTRHPHHRHPRR